LATLKGQSFHKMGCLLVQNRRHHTDSLPLSSVDEPHHLAGAVIRTAARLRRLILIGVCQFLSHGWKPLACCQATPSHKAHIRHSPLAPVILVVPFLHLTQKARHRCDLRLYLSGHPLIAKPKHDKRTECSTQDRIMVGVVMVAQHQGAMTAIKIPARWTSVDILLHAFYYCAPLSSMAFGLSLHSDVSA